MRKYIDIVERITNLGLSDQPNESSTELSRLTPETEPVSFAIMYTDGAKKSAIEEIVSQYEVERFIETQPSKIAKPGFHVWCERESEKMARKFKMARLDGVIISTPVAR